MSKLLEIREADVVFSSGLGGRVKKHALTGISLAVGGADPAVTAVVGESGSGKTTLIRLLLGFQSPTRGEVAYDGRPLDRMRRAERRRFRREVQAIFQDPFDTFNPFYRIDHPLLAPLKSFGIASSRDEAYQRIETTLEKVGLRPAETLGRYPHQLSGGQRQRVMIARALLLDPGIILADEPVSMVDASLRSTILDILFELNRDLGISIVYVTHDLTTAYQVADSIVVLHGGQVMEVGATDKVIHDPRHPYTRALIEAVPSPDPEVHWNLEDEVLAGSYAPPSTRLSLYPTDALRAVAEPHDPARAAVTASDIQLAVSRERRARAAG